MQKTKSKQIPALASSLFRARSVRTFANAKMFATNVLDENICAEIPLKV